MSVVQLLFLGPFTIVLLLAPSTPSPLPPFLRQTR